MPKIILLKGLPASGKSTWAREQLQKGTYMRISKDDLREDMLGPFSQKKEKLVLKLRNELIRLGIEMGKNVIIDDTNLNPIHEKHIRQIAKELGATFVVNDTFMSVSPEECIERDLHRGDKAVGSQVIWKMYDQWIKKDPTKQLDVEWDKRRCVIFDIDGTLAHNTSGRNWYDYTKVMLDTPDPFLSVVADSLNENVGVDYLDIVIVSGREDNCKKETEEWLQHNMIPYKHIYMRKTGDHRPDEIVKEEIYHTYIEPNWAVLGVFDDRPKVARMWRSLGLNVAQMGNPYVEF